jgi:hypothetical protein
LLEERERMIFNSLGVFRGGFSLDAARAVSLKESGGERDLQAHLLSLTEKNLVNRDCSMRGEARFTLRADSRACSRKGTGCGNRAGG